MKITLADCSTIEINEYVCLIYYFHLVWQVNHSNCKDGSFKEVQNTNRATHVYRSHPLPVHMDVHTHICCPYTQCFVNMSSPSRSDLLLETCLKVDIMCSNLKITYSQQVPCLSALHFSSNILLQLGIINLRTYTEKKALKNQIWFFGLSPTSYHFLISHNIKWNGSCRNQIK